MHCTTLVVVVIVVVLVVVYTVYIYYYTVVLLYIITKIYCINTTTPYILLLQNETLSEKEIKRLGFALSEVRYNELLPLLARLNELEEQQAEEEGPSRQRGSGGRGAAGECCVCSVLDFIIHMCFIM